ncbi:MAG: YihY/virulence factor BrkB family protein [Pirellulaceae bacterium]
MIYGVSAKKFLWDLYVQVSSDNVFNGAAALAFYLTLAIFPTLILLMTAIPYLPVDDLDSAIMDVLGTALPPEAYGLVEGVVEEVTSQRRGGLLSFGLLGTIWAATTGMYAIMQQLNITYKVTEARSFLWGRFLALLLSLLFGVLVLGAFSLVVLGGYIEAWAGEFFGLPEVMVTIFGVLRWIIVIIGMLLGFAIIYYFAPNVKQKFKFITVGSLFGSTLMILASLAFAAYTRNFADYNATYGSIGAVIILMLWLYMAGLVILIGSVINVLLEHYSPDGKQMGERVKGEHDGVDPVAN